MGGKSGTNTVTNNSAPPQQFLDAYQNVLNQGQQVASQPLQQYSGNIVAGLSPEQQAAIGTVNSSQGIAAPYINAAAQAFGQATQPVMGQAAQNYLQASANGSVANTANSGADAIRNSGNQGSSGIMNAGASGVGNILGASNSFNPNSISQFMSPYTQSVVDATQRQFNNQNAIQQQGVVGNAISSGAYGGDRSAVAQGVTAGQQASAQAPVIAGLMNTGYQNATQAAEQQAALQLQGSTAAGQLGVGAATNAGQLGLSAATSAGQQALTGAGQEAQLQAGVGNAYLGADQANKWLDSQAAFGLSSLGQEAQSTALTGANAQLGVGGLEQQQAQEQLNVPYQQFLQQQAYPYQTTGWLAGLAEGTGGASGGTGTSSGTSTPSALSSIAGLGTSALGVAGLTGGFGSNGWLTGENGIFSARGGAIPSRANGGIVGNDNAMPHSQQMTGTNGGIMGYAPGGGVSVPTMSGGPGGAISVSVAPGSGGGVAVPTLSFNGAGVPSSGNVNSYLAANMGSPGAHTTSTAWHPNFIPAPASAVTTPGITATGSSGLNGAVNRGSAGIEGPGGHNGGAGAAMGTNNAGGMPGQANQGDPRGGAEGIGGGSATGPGDVGAAAGSAHGFGINGGTIGGMLGGIAGGMLGGPLGSMAGSALGSSIGHSADGDSDGGGDGGGDGGVGGGMARGGILHRDDGGDIPVPPIPPDVVPPMGGIAGVAPQTGGISGPPAAPDPYAVDYKPRVGQGEDVASIRKSAPWLGVLGAGLGMLGGRSTNGVENIGQGALEGLKLYAGETQRADALDERQSEQADAGAYRQSGLKLDAQKMHDAVDEAKARLAQQDKQIDQTGAYQQGQLGIERSRVGLEGARLAQERELAMTPPDVREAQWLSNATPEQRQSFFASKGQFDLMSPSAGATAPIADTGTPPAANGASIGYPVDPKTGLVQLPGNVLAPPSALGADTGTRNTEFLAKLPPALAGQVKAMDDGRLPIPTRPNPAQQQLLQALSIYNPGFDYTNAPMRLAIDKDLQTGKGATARDAANTLIGHMKELKDAFDAQGNTDIPAVNSVGNWIGTQTGSEKTLNVQRAAQAVASEARRLYAASNGGNLAELEDWKNGLSPNMSPEQQGGSFSQLANLMVPRLDSLASRYNEVHHTNISGIDLLDPGSRKILQGILGQKQEQPESGGATQPQQAAPQQAAPTMPPMPPGLPAGSQYSPSRNAWRDPSGKIYPGSPP